MKKLITLSAALFAATSLFSQTIIQTNFANWTAGSPDGWNGSRTTATVAQFPSVPSSALRGGYLATIVNKSSNHKRFTNVGTAVAAGNYEVKVWYYADSTLDLRINFYDGTYGTYNNYKVLTAASVPTANIYSDTLTVSSAATAGEFILSLRNTNATGLGIDSIAITKLGGSTTPPATYVAKSIYDIQFTTSTSGDSPLEDSLVETTGIVTGTHGSGYFIQDGTTAWNGIYVYDNTNTPNRGDSIVIRGKVAEYFNLTQIKNIDTLITVSAGNALPTPVALTTSSIADEQYEGMLAKVSAVICVDSNAGFGEWDVANTAMDTLPVDDLLFGYTPVQYQGYDVTGLVYYSFGEFKLEPRDSMDIVQNITISLDEKHENLDLSVFPNPVSSIFTLEGVNLGTAEIINAEGKLIRTISLNYINTIDVSDLTNGVYIIKVSSDKKVGYTRFVKQ